MALRWLQQPADQAEGWIRHRPTSAWLRKPMLLIGGWWDPHLRGLLDLLKTARSSGGNPELHIGPATHLQWWPETNQLLLDFFNQHLKSPPTHSKDKTADIKLWDQGDARWSSQSGTECSSACWHLGSQGLACFDLKDGQLLDAAMPGSGTCVIVHDPWRPAPAIGGHLSPTAGPCDRKLVDQRSDVAVFSSAPLQSSLQLCGRPLLMLKVSADQPAFDLCAALSRIPADREEVQQLSTGVLRVRRSMDAEHSQITLELQPLFVSFQAGDRLRLSLAGASWPAIGVNPGDGEQRFGPPNSECRVITLFLDLDEATLRMAPLLVPQAG
jgi:putative CocE/NonD family hydrolase